MADTQTCHVIKGLPLCPEPNADGRTCSKVGKCLGSTPTPVPAATSERCEWRFDGRGSITCSCGAGGKADPQHWQILAVSCDGDTKCRACGKVVKLIARESV